MKSIWKTNYENNDIKIINSWFNGEKLFVNNVLQDERMGFFSSNLTGHVRNARNEKEIIKVSLFGWFKIDCKLFINDQNIEVTKEK